MESNLCISVGFLDKHMIDYLLKLLSIFSSFSSALNPASFPQQLYMRHCCNGFTAATTAEGRCQNKPLTVFIQFRNCYMAGRQTAVGYLSFRQGCSHGLYTFGFTEGTALQLPLGTFRSLRALLGPKSLSDSLSVTGPETPIGHISFR